MTTTALQPPWRMSLLSAGTVPFLTTEKQTLVEMKDKGELVLDQNGK